MFNTIRNAWRIPDLRKKILYTLLIIIVFRFGSVIPAPFLDASALSELMALDFAIDELGLYLVTHADDQEVLNLYWKYIALAKEGRARYQEQYGPLTQTTVTEGGYRWLNDPWPWDEGGSD